MKATIIQQVIRRKLEVLQDKVSMYNARLKEMCALKEELQAFGSQVQGSAIHDVSVQEQEIDAPMYDWSAPEVR